MTEYACHNHSPNLITSDYTAADGTIVPARWLPVQCGHTESGTDPRCNGCRWRQECEHAVIVHLDGTGEAICDDCKTVIRR